MRRTFNLGIGMVLVVAREKCGCAPAAAGEKGREGAGHRPDRPGETAGDLRGGEAMRPDGRVGILISGRGSNMESIIAAAEEGRIRPWWRW